MIRLLIRNIKHRIVDMLSLDSMSSEYNILAVNHIFLMVYATLESIFVNTLLYRVTPDISIIILYRGITYVSSAITMHFAAYIGQKKTPLFILRLGSLLFLLMYACLFFGMGHMSVVMYIAAPLTGIGGAFYWSGHNILVTHYTTAQNRDIGISILCIILGITTLFVPIISGFVISFFENTFNSVDIGYRVIFGIGMVIVLAQVRYQRKLPAVEQLKHKSELKLALSLFMRESSYKIMLCYEVLRGFRDGTFGFILNMLLFEIITSETLVGLNAFLTGIMAIIGAWAYGKLVNPSLRTRYSLISSTAMLVFCLLLLLNSTAPAFMLFAMINAFFALFITNITNNCTIDVITMDESGRKCIGESVAIREVFLTIGRVGGLYVFTLFPSTMTGRILAMIILTASQYIVALLVDITGRLNNRGKTADDIVVYEE